jgi:putative iron-dependent peroxidase
VDKAQSGIYAEPNLHGLTLFCHVMSDDVESLRRKLSRFPAIIQDLDARFSEAMLTGFVGIGAEYWDILYPHKRPLHLQAFPELSDADREAPRHPFDLVLHIRCDRFDANYLAGRTIMEWFGYDIEVAEQIRSFRYLDGRDLLGFIDAPDNPRGMRKREASLINATDDTAFVDGSYLFVQKIRYDLRRWDYLGPEKQEQIMGREKVSGERLPEAMIDGVTHAAKAKLMDKNEQPIPLLRQNMPWGDLREQGLLGMYFSHAPKSVVEWLKARYYADEQGQYDPILDYSQAVLNSSFFVPSTRFLLENRELPVNQEGGSTD